MIPGGEPSIVPAGDAALLATFADVIDPEVNARVRAVASALETSGARGVTEVTIAYSTLLVHFDPVLARYEGVRELVLDLSRVATLSAAGESRLREIPAVFGGAYGPDLLEVARLVKLPVDEFLRQVMQTTYTVFMLGFSPGNPYLGGLPPHLALPRLPTPRERVPAGTVALANQVNVYSLTSPGGWRWLGRTPLKMFDPDVRPPTYLEAGDRVRFVKIDEAEYLNMGGEKAE